MIIYWSYNLKTNQSFVSEIVSYYPYHYKSAEYRVIGILLFCVPSLNP